MFFLGFVLGALACCAVLFIVAAVLAKKDDN